MLISIYRIYSGEIEKRELILNESNVIFIFGNYKFYILMMKIELIQIYEPL